MPPEAILRGAEGGSRTEALGLTTKVDPAPVTAEELAGGAPQVETQVPAML